MLRNKEFFDLINEKIEHVCYKTKQIKEDSAKINAEFNIPLGLLSDYLTLRVPADDASDFVLYAISTIYLTKNQIEEFYTKDEIKFYNKSKFRKQGIKFPIRFDMIQINTTQWIGNIDAQTLMRFRDAQMINYNERTQRTMERKLSHGYEYYQIFINDNAVKEIEESYEKGSYIPNTITLNLSDDSEADFVYDNENKQLIIRSIKYFDILDGYHRYRAISKAYSLDSDFNYEMELRIVNFSERNARQFIWQEDQKTKMNKIDSASYNQNNWAVYICDRLSKSLPQDTIGISRNKGQIDLAQFAEIIQKLYNTNKIRSSKEAIKIANELTTKFEDLLLESPEAFDKKWPATLTTCVLIVFQYTNKNVWDLSMRVYKRSLSEKVWDNGTINKKKITALQQITESEKGGEIDV